MVLLSINHRDGSQSDMDKGEVSSAVLPHVLQMMVFGESSVQYLYPVKPRLTAASISLLSMFPVATCKLLSMSCPPERGWKLSSIMAEARAAVTNKHDFAGHPEHHLRPQRRSLNGLSWERDHGYL